MGRRAGQARRRGGEAPPGAVLHALWAAVACRSAFVGTCCEAFARCCAPALPSPAHAHAHRGGEGDLLVAVDGEVGGVAAHRGVADDVVGRHGGLDDLELAVGGRHRQRGQVAKVPAGGRVGVRAARSDMHTSAWSAHQCVGSAERGCGVVLCSVHAHSTPLCQPAILTACSSRSCRRRPSWSSAHRAPGQCECIRC